MAFRCLSNLSKKIAATHHNVVLSGKVLVRENSDRNFFGNGIISSCFITVKAQSGHRDHNIS